MKNLLANHALAVTLGVVAGATAGWFSDSNLLILGIAAIGVIVGTLLEKTKIIA